LKPLFCFPKFNLQHAWLEVQMNNTYELQVRNYSYNMQKVHISFIRSSANGFDIF